MNVDGTRNVAALGAPVVYFSTRLRLRRDEARAVRRVGRDRTRSRSTGGRSSTASGRSATAGSCASSWLFGPTGQELRAHDARARRRAGRGARSSPTSAARPTYVGHLAAAHVRAPRPARRRLAPRGRRASARGPSSRRRSSRRPGSTAASSRSRPRSSGAAAPRPAYSVLRSERPGRAAPPALARRPARACLARARALASGRAHARHRRRRVHRLPLRQAPRRGRRGRRRPRQADVRGEPREPRGRRARVPPGRHRRPRRRRRRPARGCDAIVNFAAETHVDRSILDAGEFIRTDVVGTHVLLEWAREHGRPVRPGLHRRGLRRRRAGERLARGRPAAAVEPVRGVEGGRRPAGARRTSARTASTRRSRAARTPTGRTSTRRSSSRSSSRTRSTASRCRSTATGARCATGCTWTTTAPAIELVLREGAPGEVYNVGGGEELENGEVTRRILELTGRATSRSSATSRTGPATTAATRSTRPSSATLGWEPERALRGRARRDGRLVPRQPRLVGADQVRRVPRVLRAPVRRAARLA